MVEEKVVEEKVIEEKQNEVEIKKYTNDELSNMNLTDLKKVAKDYNVVLSVGGKAKTKSQLVNDILAKN
jgi:uncharacterized FlgJ-related protein